MVLYMWFFVSSASLYHLTVDILLGCLCTSDQDSFRFGARVDAEKFLSALDQKARSHRKETVKQTREGL